MGGLGHPARWGGVVPCGGVLIMGRLLGAEGVRVGSDSVYPAVADW